MNLGLRLKRYRTRKGLTQKEAAEIIGINAYQLGNYETNRSEPSIKILKRMSQAYQTSIDDLVGNKIDPSNVTKDKYSGEEVMKVLKEYFDSIEDKD